MNTDADSSKPTKCAGTKQQEEKPKTQKSATSPDMKTSGFNRDEFVARMSLNEKTANILRTNVRGLDAPITPITPVAPITPITPIAQFASIGPFYPITPDGVYHCPNAAAMCCSAGVRVCDIIDNRYMTKGLPVSARQAPPIQIPKIRKNIVSASTVTEPPLNARSAAAKRSGRYSVDPLPMFSLDNDPFDYPIIVMADYKTQSPKPMPPPSLILNHPSVNQRGGTDNNGWPTRANINSSPVILTNGTMLLYLRNNIRIDITLDKTIRVLNENSMVAIALSGNGNSAAFIHPNGRIWQSGSKVEIVAYDGLKKNNYVRYAKMFYKGISFTSDACALTYLVDTAGTRTTTDSFTDLSEDYTLTVLYSDSIHGPCFVKDVARIIQKSRYDCLADGTEIYNLHGFHIIQAADGLVKVTRGQAKCLICTSPSNGSATLTTPSLHCTASLGTTSHLFVRRNEKRMHFDGASFSVRNAGHSAGFNANNLLIVY